MQRFLLTAILSCSLITALPTTTTPDQLTFSIADSLVFDFSTLSDQHAILLKEHIDSLPESRTVETENGIHHITEGAKALLVLNQIKFIDVTDSSHSLLPPLQQTQGATKPFPAKVQYEVAEFKRLYSHIDTSEMKAFLTQFTSFRTRYYRSPTGKQSQAFLLSTIRSIVAAKKGIHVTVTEFVHPWGQNSIIARFEPQSNMSDEIVIIGAHQDSTNLLPFLPASGADDDGSGTTSILTAFKALVNESFTPSSHPVEFHWYSAEEGGLLGSSAVAQSYLKTGKKVRSMLQIDMSAWVKAGTQPVIGIIQDFVDPGFTAFLTKVVAEYADIPSVETKCGYACSDHASWTKIGAPAGFSIESRFEDSNQNIHSIKDRIDISPEFSFEHMAQFSKVAIALAVELGGGDAMLV